MLCCCPVRVVEDKPRWLKNQLVKSFFFVSCPLCPLQRRADNLIVCPSLFWFVQIKGEEKRGDQEHLQLQSLQTVLKRRRTLVLLKHVIMQTYLWYNIQLNPNWPEFDARLYWKCKMPDLKKKKNTKPLIKVSGIDSTAVLIFVDLLIKLVVSVFSANISRNIKTAVLKYQRRHSRIF